MTTLTAEQKQAVLEISTELNNSIHKDLEGFAGNQELQALFADIYDLNKTLTGAVQMTELEEDNVYDIDLFLIGLQPTTSDPTNYLAHQPHEPLKGQRLTGFGKGIDNDIFNHKELRSGLIHDNMVYFYFTNPETKETVGFPVGLVDLDKSVIHVTKIYNRYVNIMANLITLPSIN